MSRNRSTRPEPVHQFAAKSARVRSLMEDQGFSPDQIRAITANLRPATVDAVVRQLEEWGAEHNG